MLLAYEAFAVASRRLPSFTVICRRHRWAVPLVLAGICPHLLRKEVNKL